MQIKSTIKVTKWDESELKQISDISKLSTVLVEYGFDGDLIGKALVGYHMFYDHFNESNPMEGKASYLGFMFVEGTIGDKSGSFVLKDEGVFESGTATSSITIIEGSGAEGFEGISGDGFYRASHTESLLELNISL